MAKVIEIEGKTIDEAIYLGLDQLKLTIDEVDMEVIEYGQKGFMGIGYKPAKVKITQREEAIIPDFILNKDKEKAPHKEKREKPRKDKKIEAFEEKKGEYFPEGTEFVENEVTEFLQGLMNHIGIKESTVKAANTDNGLLVNLEGNDMGILIGRRGETLDAVQYLASLVYNKDKEDYHRVTVDTENYRKKRENTLIRLAKKKAGQVAKTGKKVVLEPMSPFERRIIHFALQNDKFVTTYSEGEEPNRHIVIDKK
ncbi:MAG: protein jag [Clostridiales bacterium]|nr:protein jag [Clostridiales bacterium]